VDAVVNIDATQHRRPGAAATVHPPESLWSQVRAYLPEGRELPQNVWNQRQRIVVTFVLLHAVGLTVFGLVQGWGAAYALGEGGIIALLGAIATQRFLGRRFRSATAALGAVTSSAVLTQFWGGYIEAHFHYFVVVALIALYQDWIPFLLAIGYVAFDHGLIGSIQPTWVYNHPDALAHPWKWAVIHATLVLAECSILVVLWKATERARAQADLVLTSAGEGIVGVDIEGRITFANPAAATMLGRPRTDLRGLDLQQLLVGRTTATMGTQILEAFRSGAVHTGSGRTSFKQGDDEVFVDWSVSPVQEHGIVVGNVLTLADSTDRKRAEREHEKRVQQLAELEKLKELDQFKTLFINTAAHELHTPLTPLRLHVYALKEGHHGELNREQLSTVDILERNVERMSRLVDDVLNAARLQGNRMTLARSTTDLGALANDALDSFKESTRAGGITLEAMVASRIMVEADSKRLMQVFYNLLDNAIKFTPTGGRIHVEVRRSGGGGTVSVTDSGIGLKPGQAQKLFQPFVQGHDPMKETRVGSGLGLYISRGIIELHGGRMDCFSAGPGKGSTFSFTLPLSDLKPAVMREAVATSG
jgi:PAS domain S-box-containing protein